MVMLRFDVPPVHANAVRLDAVITFIICIAALAFGLPWLLLVLAVAGFIRGFIGHYRCPIHRSSLWLVQRIGKPGPQENAGAKMFAAKVLFIASAIGFGLWLGGSTLWKVPATVLAIFSFVEWAFSFCAGCWAYTLWYRFRPQE
jgi:hypothetical protein